MEVARLGKRIYRDELKLEREDDWAPRHAGATGSTATTPASTTSPAPTSPPWRRGASRSHPMHFDLTDLPGIEALSGFDLHALLDSAEVEAG